MITTYQNAQEFLLKTQEILEAKEAENNLMLGICLRLVQYPERIKDQPYLATVEDDGNIVFAAVMTPPHQLVVFSRQTDSDWACRLVVGNLLANKWKVPGVLGASQLSGRFAEIWAEISDGVFREGMSQRIYELRKVVQPAAVPGALRMATNQDFTLATEWAFEFSEEALGKADRADVEEMVKNKISDGEIFIWEDGQPVSMAATTRSLSTGGVISLVYTPPKWRKRGYASACVAALSRRKLESGWQFCALFADLSNPTSNAIYQNIGYMPVCDFQQYLFEGSESA